MTSEVATKYNVGGILLDRPFKIRRLGHFGFNGINVEESLRFYTDLLGFQISDEVPIGYFLRYGHDHHAFALFHKSAWDERIAANPDMRRPAPDNNINQITWQTQSLSEPVHAVDYLASNGIERQRFGRDGAGSNWATYFYDPDGYTNELYYGIEQIGWDGRSKPEQYRRPFSGRVQLPVMSEHDEVNESAATTGVPVSGGYRYEEQLPRIYDVDGILLARPFKIVKHGPVNIWVDDVTRSRDFYAEKLGFDVTEEVAWEGERVAFLRCNTEHHSLGLFPRSLRERLGFNPDDACMSFGVQLGNYRQLRAAVDFLREQGARVETNLIPQELYPGIDYSAWTFDADGHCIQLYYYMEQIGWDGKPRPASMRRQVDPNDWPDTLEPLPDTFKGEPFLGPWG